MLFFKKFLFIFFFSFTTLFGKNFKQTPMNSYEKFIKNSSKVHRLKFEENEIEIDLHETMYKLIKVESCFKQIKNNGHAIGICQIEPYTFNSMYKDKRFIEERKKIEKHFKVNLLNYKRDNYTNIVSAYCVIIYKAKASPKLYKKYSKRIKKYNDKNWYIYKLYYNSPKGKTTYKRWNA